MCTDRMFARGVVYDSTGASNVVSGAEDPYLIDAIDLRFYPDMGRYMVRLDHSSLPEFWFQINFSVKGPSGTVTSRGEGRVFGEKGTMVDGPLVRIVMIQEEEDGTVKLRIDTKFPNVWLEVCLSKEDLERAANEAIEIDEEEEE